MTRVRATIRSVLCAVGISCGIAQAQVADLAVAERELHGVFERAEGAPIGDEQKQKLAAS